jgi:N utilization substance protein A
MTASSPSARGPRSGQPRQDRRDSEGFLDRPGRRLRRYARQPRAGGGAELQGEKIDIIPWTAGSATFVVSALQPAEVAKVVLDEQAERIEVVVPDEQLSLAIGRRGQNVRLASQLIGWDIDILTEAEESERRQKEFTERTKLCSWRPWTWTRWWPSSWLRKASRRLRNWPISTRRNRLDPGLRRGDGGRAPEPRQPCILAAIEKANGRRAHRARRCRRPLRLRGPERRHAGGARQGRHQDGRRLRRLCADELVGWTERKDGETVKHKGYLSDHGVTAAEAEALILQARVQLGWIEAPAVAADAEAEAESDA